MSFSEWVDDNPIKATLVGGAAVTAAVLSRGRLAEAAFGAAKDIVKAGEIEVAPGLKAMRMGDMLRFTAPDGLTVEASPGLLNKLSSGLFSDKWNVQAQLPDASAIMNLTDKGVSVRMTGATANVNSYTLSARVDGLPRMKTHADSYDGPTTESGQFKFGDRSFSGPGINLRVRMLHGPGDPVDIWLGTFGGHVLDDFSRWRTGIAMAPAGGEKVHAVATDGIVLGAQRFRGPDEFKSFRDVARMFETRV